MRPCPSGGLGHVNQQLPRPWPGPHACSAHRRAGSLTTVGPSSSASLCPCGQCCSWSSGSGQTHPWHIAGTALSLRTLRWGPTLCNTFQNCMDKSHQLPLMPFPPLSQERPRPQFTAMAPMTIINPITGAEEPYFPKRSRIHRILAGLVVIIMLVRSQGLEKWGVVEWDLFEERVCG